FSRGIELRFKELKTAAHHFIEIYWLKLGRRHFREVAEASDDDPQIGKLGEQGGCAFVKHLLELARIALPRAQQVLYRDLKGKERIFQLVRQPPRQLAPGRHTLRLHQAVALLHQLLRHLEIGRASCRESVWTC